MVLTGRRFEGIKAVYSLGGRVTVATFSDFNSDIRITIKYNIFLRRAHKTVIRLRPKLDRVKKKKKNCQIGGRYVHYWVQKHYYFIVKCLNCACLNNCKCLRVGFCFRTANIEKFIRMFYIGHVNPRDVEFV